MLEQQVIEAARRGEWIKPKTTLPIGRLTVTNNKDLMVRAKLLRELLMGHHGDLDPRGLHIQGMRIVGRLDLDNVTAVTSLVLKRCALPNGMTCNDARLRDVVLSGSHLRRLSAHYLRTDGALVLDKIVITGNSKNGALGLAGAHIGDFLALRQIQNINNTGPCLVASDLRTDGDVSLEGAKLHGSSDLATIQLHGAHIGGQLNLDDTEIINDSGPALIAEDLRTDGHTFIRASYFRGTGTAGTVRLSGADIGGHLKLDSTEIKNCSGPALYADTLRTDSSVSLSHVAATGNSEFSAVRLLRARIGGQLHMDGIQTNNTSGRLIALTEAHVTGVLVLPTSLVCPHALTETNWNECPDSRRRIVVGGLVFPILAEEVSCQQWLHLLMHHTPTYMAQPYQQLAAIERAAGHDNNARQVLITQQEDLRRRAPKALGGRFAQARHRLWGWLGRYGYRAHRLVFILAIVLFLTGGVGYLAGQVDTRPGHHAAERVRPLTAPPDAPGTPCSTVELFGLGVDRGLPLGTTGLRARCDLDTGTRRGQAFTYILWTLQALMWSLATLAIAAYTGLVRKPA